MANKKEKKSLQLTKSHIAKMKKRRRRKGKNEEKEEMGDRREGGKNTGLSDEEKVYLRITSTERNKDVLKTM